MALFGKGKQTPSFTQAPPLQAAAGSAPQVVGQFFSYSVGSSTELALSNATVALESANSVLAPTEYE